MTGNLPMKFVQDERAQFDNLICDLCILVICFGCCCGGRWLDKKGKKDLKEYKDYLNSASEKEVLIEILKKQDRK